MADLPSVVHRVAEVDPEPDPRVDDVVQPRLLGVVVPGRARDLGANVHVHVTTPDELLQALGNGCAHARVATGVLR
jgi:hypothetical protein